MKLRTFASLVLALACTSHPATSATLHVWQDSPSPGPPFSTWVTAAHTIQDAVDAAVDGDTVLVMGGVYDTGGRAVVGLMTNRVAIDKAIRVESLTGPEVTLIVGAEAPGGGNGDGAVRCVYLGTNAVLSGFTLTNGHTRNYPADYETEQSGGGVWCEISGLVTNCVLTANLAEYQGGGAHGGTLYNCTLSGNSAQHHGGGAYRSGLYNCTLVANAATSEWGSGGGAYGGTLYNCTLTGNSAAYEGGGACGGTLYNSIVYYNTASSGPNHASSTCLYSCTTPLPPGEGNIHDDPQLASTSHLSSSSPCIGAGSAAYCKGVDIDGEAWLDPPCMGGDQVVPGNVMGPITVAIQSAYTGVAVGFALPFTGAIEGPLNASAWDFGDGTILSNQPYASHAWSAPGNYTVRLTGFNDSHPEGVSGLFEIQVLPQPVCYVDQANPAPVFPYQTWEAAAQTIQEAVNASTLPGRLVLVTNGVYGGGVVLIGSARVQSVNGPAVTVIHGSGANLGAGGVLSGFTLTNGGVYCEASAVVSNCIVTGSRAGGVLGGTLYNCILTNNSVCLVSMYPARSGGGAVCCTLYNCTLTDNRVEVCDPFSLADTEGGGAAFCTLYNCTLTGNWADYGGGAYHSTLYNCTLTGNWADYGGGAYHSTLYNCTLTGNSAGYGGGAYGGTLCNCTLTGNGAWAGVGVYGCVIYGCTLQGNSAQWEGGGAFGGRLYGSTLMSNRAGASHVSGGGGACQATLQDCLVTGNYAPCEFAGGGGVIYCTVFNCLLSENWAWAGGGASDSTLYNCTIIGNRAEGVDSSFGGGVSSSRLYSSIVYCNTALSGPNHSWSAFHYCCTTPLPNDGLGNIDADPSFLNRAAGDFRLALGSPCIDAGSDFDLGGGTNLSDIITTDLAGLPRVVDGNGDGMATFDMGAYECPPPTPAEMVELVAQQINQSNLPSNRKTPLLATLEAAQASFDRGSLASGINQLRALQNKVRSQVPRSDPDFAETLVQAAERIIDSAIALDSVRKN